MYPYHETLSCVLRLISLLVVSRDTWVSFWCSKWPLSKCPTLPSPPHLHKYRSQENENHFTWRWISCSLAAFNIPFNCFPMFGKQSWFTMLSNPRGLNSCCRSCCVLSHCVQKCTPLQTFELGLLKFCVNSLQFIVFPDTFILELENAWREIRKMTSLLWEADVPILFQNHTASAKKVHGNPQWSVLQLDFWGMWCCVHQVALNERGGSSGW